jgi:predicted ATPase
LILVLTQKKIVALVGPNGCGKSSIFDGFELQLQRFRNHGSEDAQFYSKSFFYSDNRRNEQYNAQKAVNITFDLGSLNRKSFYIRTSYRFTPKIEVQQIALLPSILDLNDEPISTIALDLRLGSNYQRLLGASYTAFTKGVKTGNQVRDELIGKINNILSNILDVHISDLGNPLEGRGQLYFKKGNTIDFPYANLSSGEKEVIDLVIDLVVKSKEYTETVYCIDEPDLHLSTAIQRKLLVEIDKLIPEDCQLWIATHSIGFMRALQNELKEKSQILDFSQKDYFTGSRNIQPIVPNRRNWMRIFETALDDLTNLVGPNRIVYCEGRAEPGIDGIEKGLDAQIYENIFSAAFDDTVFVSSGGNTELDQRSDIAIQILSKVFNGIEILVLKDRDMSSGKLTDETARQLYLSNNPPNHRVLKRWELENYLFDKEILSKYCKSKGLTFSETDYDNFVTDINNQNVKDEINRIKNFCGIQSSIGEVQFKLNLSKFITQETDVYQELRECIFNESNQ